MILIGSQAIRHYLPEWREPADLDLVGTYDEAVAFRKAFGAISFYPINEGKSIFMKNREGRICEIEIAWEGSRAEKLMQQWHAIVKTTYAYGVQVFVPSLNTLYALKMSHRYLKNSPHFWKTMADIRALRAVGCFIPDDWLPWYLERVEDTYTYKHPNLDVGKGEFFDTNMTGVVQKYDHDSIHEAVALYGKPAYTFYLDGPVKCSREMFYQQPYHIQLAGVMEEAMVLALERSLIPFPGGKTPEEAFRFALMKVCTSITSGWFREFAWEKHDIVLELFLEEQKIRCYTDRFNKALEAGIVKLKEAS